MKPLHLLHNPAEKRGFNDVIQVANGYVYTTDGIAFVRFPIVEVFGDDFGEPIIEDTEVLYFKKAFWRDGKIFKAASFSRNGNTFHALDKKGKEIGSITATEAPDGFPPIDAFINGGAPFVLGLDLNAKIIEDIANVINVDTFHVRRNTLDGEYPNLLYPNIASKAVAGFRGLENSPSFVDIDAILNMQDPAGMNEALRQDQLAAEGLDTVEGCLERIAQLENQVAHYMTGSAMEHLENELIDLKLEKDKLEGSLTEAENKIEEIVHKSAEAWSEAEEAKKQRDETQQKLDEVAAQNSLLKATNETLQEDHKNLHDRLREAEKNQIIYSGPNAELTQMYIDQLNNPNIGAAPIKDMLETLAMMY